MRNIFHTTLIFFTLIFSFMLWGCSSGNPNSPQFDSNGKHPADWVDRHGNEFRKDSAQCVTCHGSFTDPETSGGISGVSCFSVNRGTQTCHPDGPSGHPPGWEAPSQHGRSGAMAAPSARSGFKYCTRCHGAAFDEPVTRSCFTCHTNAPHPDAPWHGTTASGTNHVETDTGNASECAKCHLNNRQPPSYLAVPAGTLTGCFNNTLCHGQDIGHPSGWDDPAQHGVAAKAAATASSGLGYCRQCHGSDYAGSGAAVSCFSCHPPAPHGFFPWLASSNPTHTNTDQSNATFCAQCHRNGNNLTSIPEPPLQPAATPSGCFNNTLCHGSEGATPHAIPFIDPAAHGTAAKANLASCQTCHATPASGSNPRFTVANNGNLSPNGCENCHPTAHPSPWLPGRGSSGTHATAGTLSTSCALCHGSALNGVGGSGPSCMSASRDGIRCHVSSPVANPTGCLSCHAKPPTGSSSPNTDNAHTEHHSFFVTAEAACNACHSGHGVNFTTRIGTATHANGTANVIISSSYYAQSGTSNFTAGTCTNTRCHGGQTTPAWNTGTINVNADCTMCHQSGTSQYNSYFSGEHGDHVGAVACTTCHDTAKLATGHFSNLATTAFELPPRNTITFRNPDNGNTLTATYNAGSRTYTCNFTCHGESHSNTTWSVP